MAIEEADLAIRLMANGYVIRLGTADPIHHHTSGIRNQTRLEFLAARNSILYAWYNVPLPDLLVHLAGATFKAWLHGVKHGYLWARTRGLVIGYFDSLRQWRHRRPVPREIYRLSRRLKKMGPMPLEQVALALDAAQAPIVHNPHDTGPPPP